MVGKYVVGVLVEGWRVLTPNTALWGYDESLPNVRPLGLVRIPNLGLGTGLMPPQINSHGFTRPRHVPEGAGVVLASSGSTVLLVVAHSDDDLWHHQLDSYSDILSFPRSCI